MEPAEMVKEWEEHLELLTPEVGELVWTLVELFAWKSARRKALEGRDRREEGSLCMLEERKDASTAC